LDRASQGEVGAVIGLLTPPEIDLLVQSMQLIERLLIGKKPADSPIILRQLQLGDLGWIAHRQAILYAQEYDWNEPYEALAAEILAAFVNAMTQTVSVAGLAPVTASAGVGLHHASIGNH
jgi:hypothetical protein